jgi:hypothetical protein
MSQLRSWPTAATPGTPGSAGPSTIISPASRDTFFPRIAADTLGTRDRAARFVHGSYLAAALAPAPLWYTRFDEVTGTTAYNAARQASSFANECLADNPGLLWLFDETSGSTAADASGNGRTGAYTAFTLNQSPLIPGDTGKSILNTASGFGNRSVTSTYSPFDNSTPLAIEFVVANSTSGNESRVARSDGTDAIYIGTSSTSSTLAFQTKNGAQVVNWSGALPFDNTAYHYVLTYDPVTGVAELWRNGLSWGTREFGVGAGWGSNPGNIMFGDTGYAGWVGSADAFAVYPGGLTRARIVAHATWLLAGNVSGPTLGGPSLVGDPGDGSAVFNDSGGVYGNLQPFPQESPAEKRTFVTVVNRTSNAGNTTIFGADLGGGGSSSLYVNTTGDVVWDPGTGITQTWTGAWPGQNQSVHVALRAAPNNFELFVNGVSQGTKSTPYQWGGSNGSARVIIGAAGAFGGATRWVGYIDEFAMYDSHLTNAQIAGMAASAGTSTARVRTSADTLGTTDSATGVGTTSYVRTSSDSLGTTDAATRSALIRTRSAVDVLGGSVVSQNAGGTYLGNNKVLWDAGQSFTIDFDFVIGSNPGTTAVPLLGITGQGGTLGVTVGGYVPVAYMDTSKNLRVSGFWHGNSNPVTSIAGPFDDGTQRHLTVTYDGTSQRTYINGGLVDTWTIGQTSFSTSYEFFAGAAQMNTWSNAGTLDAQGWAYLPSNAGVGNFVFRAGVQSPLGGVGGGITDAATRGTLSRLRAAVDTLGTTDSAARLLSLLRTSADTLGTTDAAMRLRIGPRSAAADTLGTVDSAARLLPLLRTSADTLGTTDSAVGFAGKRSAADTLGTTDAATRAAILRLRAAADTLGTTDAATRAAILLRSAADVLGTTDAATRAALVRARTSADTLGTIDAATRAAILRIRTAADVLGTSDAASRLRISARSASDMLGTADTALVKSLITRFAVDALGTTDLATRLAILHRAATDVLGTTDAADAVVAFVTAPDLYGPLHALVLSDGVLSRVIALDYVAKALDFEPISKTVPTEPHQKIDLLEPHSAVELLDYVGKVS